MTIRTTSQRISNVGNTANPFVMRLGERITGVNLEPIEQTVNGAPEIESLIHQLLFQRAYEINNATSRIYSKWLTPVQDLALSLREGNYYLRIEAFRNPKKLAEQEGSIGIELTLVRDEYKDFEEKDLQSITRHKLSLFDHKTGKVSQPKDWKVNRYKCGEGYIADAILQLSTNECTEKSPFVNRTSFQYVSIVEIRD